MNHKFLLLKLRKVELNMKKNLYVTPTVVLTAIEKEDILTISYRLTSDGDEITYSSRTQIQ